MSFVDKETLRQALNQLAGTSGHLLKIWLTLKHMGLEVGAPAVQIDTSNSTESLKRLFSFGAKDESFFVPFSHTKRYMTMKGDASRSIIQTTLQRWSSSGSVVTCDPTDYLNISNNAEGKILVSTSRIYPYGLGSGESGFALKDNTRVSIPILPFAIWFGRQTEIPNEEKSAARFLIGRMIEELNISPAERDLIFIQSDMNVGLQSQSLTNSEIFEVCTSVIDGDISSSALLQMESFDDYTNRVRTMVSNDLTSPQWLRIPADKYLNELIKLGQSSILLFGPPRTGKTHLIDQLFPRNSGERATIQVHDGWGYEDLVLGLKPDEDGNWKWQDGVLKEAIESGKKYIVIEEMNRTAISQALGEVFSLLESSYRGEENSITLKNGDKFYIPPEVTFLFTMNTIDKSTEEVDDALMGRMASIEVLPSIDGLNSIASAKNPSGDAGEKLVKLFLEIQAVYPLGHGYFATLKNGFKDSDVVSHYVTRIRPVLKNYLGDIRQGDLDKIDNIVDDLFG